MDLENKKGEKGRDRNSRVSRKKGRCNYLIERRLEVITVYFNFFPIFFLFVLAFIVFKNVINK